MEIKTSELVLLVLVPSICSVVSTHISNAKIGVEVRTIKEDIGEIKEKLSIIDDNNTSTKERVIKVEENYNFLDRQLIKRRIK